MIHFSRSLRLLGVMFLMLSLLMPLSGSTATAQGTPTAAPVILQQTSAQEGQGTTVIDNGESDEEQESTCPGQVPGAAAGNEEPGTTTDNEIGRRGPATKTPSPPLALWVPTPIRAKAGVG